MSLDLFTYAYVKNRTNGWRSTLNSTGRRPPGFNFRVASLGPPSHLIASYPHTLPPFFVHVQCREIYIECNGVRGGRSDAQEVYDSLMDVPLL